MSPATNPEKLTKMNDIFIAEMGARTKGDIKTLAEIAKELIVSVHTAKAHVCSILQKMCVNDRVQAAVKAVTEGLV